MEPLLIQSSPVLFDKYVIAKGEKIPESLPLSGAIIVTRDKKHHGWLHKLFFIAQKTHNFLFRRQDDASMAHWAVILERDGDSANRHIVAHAVFPQIQQGIRNYLDPNSLQSKDVTELIVYVPKNGNLRSQIANSADNSACRQEIIKTVQAENGKGQISLSDMFLSFFKKPSLHPSKRTIKRSALTMADLLQKESIRDRKSYKRNLYCTAYATLVLQSSLLINTLSTDEQEKLRQLPRKELSQLLFKRLKKCRLGDKLSEAFWENPICQLNCRFATSSFATSVLDMQAEVHPLAST